MLPEQLPQKLLALAAGSNALIAVDLCGHPSGWFSQQQQRETAGGHIFPIYHKKFLVNNDNSALLWQRIRLE